MLGTFEVVAKNWFIVRFLGAIAFSWLLGVRNSFGALALALVGVGWWRGLKLGECIIVTHGELGSDLLRLLVWMQEALNWLSPPSSSGIWSCEGSPSSSVSCMGATTRYQLRKLDRMPNIPRAEMEARPTLDPSVYRNHLVEAQPTMSPDVEDELDVEGELSIL